VPATKRSRNTAKNGARARSVTGPTANEAAAFLQNLHTLKIGIAHQASPILERECDLDLRLCVILHTVAEGKVHPSEIAQTCCLPNSLISKHLDQLEKKGLISRSLDPKDTRRIRLTLTRDGKRVTRELTPIFTSLVGERLSRIPAARRKVFLAVLAELADAYQP